MVRLLRILAIAILALELSTFSLPGLVNADVLNEPSTALSSGPSITWPNGSQGFLIATNYEGAPDRSWKMWEDGLFDPGLIEQDFVKAKGAGFNALRIFIQNPLPAEIKAGKWDKLDAVVALARKYNLPLIITFYDYAEPDLTQVAAVDRLIAQRYTTDGAVLGYDLRNEPHFQDLATAIYPQGSLVSLQTDVLIRQYGERATQAQVNAWRLTHEGKAIIPARFTPAQAYYHANNYRIYQEFIAQAGAWVAARNYDVSILDYIESSDAVRWRPLLQALDATLAAWLAPQLDAVRSAAPQKPVTVGYSDVVLAKLGANAALNFQSVHRYPGKSLKELRIFFDLLRNLKSTFPSHPLVLEEFGYSNDVSSPAVSAIYESAIYLQLWKEGMAGGAKWMLNDLASGWDARQVNFGTYMADGSAKPIAAAVRALSRYFQNADSNSGDLNIDGDPTTGIRYAFSARDALFVTGQAYSDARLSVQADGPTQVFVSWTAPGALLMSSTARANIVINPSILLGDPGLSGKLSVFRLDGTSYVPHHFNQQGGAVAFTAEAGETYSVRLPRAGIDARIQIVWPQGNKPVSQATMANIGTVLLDRGTSRAICSSLAPTVKLWRALNSNVEELVGTGVRATRASASGTYNGWEFNDVDVSAAKDPLNKYYFRLSVDGAGDYSNVWSHGQDARTYFPTQDVPSGVGTAPPGAVDAKVEIVWPQGNLPVDKATKANIAAFLFEQGSLQSVAASWNPTVRLWRGLNNEGLVPVADGKKEMRTVGGLSFPAWVFNDVDVSAATNPRNRYYFRVTVDGVPTRSNVWSHGVDARTYNPEPKAPEPNDGC